MKTGSIFSDIYQIALSFGLMILITLLVNQVIIIAIPGPSKSDYVTVDYEDSKEEYRNQQKLFQAAMKPTNEKQFYAQTAAGIFLLFISMIIEPPIALGLMLAGLLCFSMGYFTGWDIVPKLVQLLFLIIASALIMIAGIRFKVKK